MGDGNVKLPGVLIIRNTLNGTGPPGRIQILPPGGMVKSVHGDFVFDDRAAEELVEKFNRRKNDLVIDYEHQTLTGAEAPAAGWIKALAYNPAQGLWADVEWTPRGAEYVKNKEYRYLSPVVRVRKSDNRAVELHSAALTNDPAIDGMVPIANKAGNKNKEEDMNEFLKKLAKSLGLADDATEDAVLEKCTALMKPVTVVAHKDVLTLLGAADDASLDDVKGKIMALKNPAGFVKAEDYEALKKQLADKETTDMVELALKDGKITPAQKTWAMEYAKTAPESFKEFVAMTAKGAAVPVGEELAGGKKTDAPAADETETQVNKALGLTEDDVKKYGKAGK